SSTPARSGTRWALASHPTRARPRGLRPPLPLAQVLSPPSPPSPLAIVLVGSYAMCLRFSLDVDVQQTLRQPLELVAPPRVVSARQAAQLDAYRTWTCGSQPNPDPA